MYKVGFQSLSSQKDLCSWSHLVRAAGFASFSSSSHILLYLTFQKRGGAKWVSLARAPAWPRWSHSSSLRKFYLPKVEKGPFKWQWMFLTHLLRRPSPEPQVASCLWTAGTGRRWGRLGGRDRTAVNQRRRLRISVETQDGERCLPGPCLGVWSLFWVNPLLILPYGIFSVSSRLTNALGVSG